MSYFHLFHKPLSGDQIKPVLLFLFFFTGVGMEANSQESEKIRVSVRYVNAPIFKNKPANGAMSIRIHVPEGRAVSYNRLTINLTNEAAEAIDQVNVHLNERFESSFDEESSLAGSAKPSAKTEIPLQISCNPGLTYLWISVVLKNNANVDRTIGMKVANLTTEDGERHTPETLNEPHQLQAFHIYRIGMALRKASDDGIHTYRIPGVVTTDKGTLIAVYDIRHNTSRDLPGHIDVAMSRSTDGGRKWEPMRTIMDMGPPHENNGIGDPSILFDPETKTIWVAALWSKGNRSIAGSEPGLSPDTTGQFVLVHSKDDGLTWSEPVSITHQVKNPKWHIYFAGPGAGIAMKNGTLVFPSQFWDESKKPGIPHSSIIYSVDHGKSWKSGLGAKPNTTESQVVETTPGTLMLNMRDNRGSFRSISVTKDLGRTWTEHHTSQQALPDPVCMGSIIMANVRIRSTAKDVLFFSNVASSSTRENTTIKASPDLGESWPATNHLLIDERRTYGYSCLTRIDEHTIGILYEGVRDLYFLRIAVSDILK